jgi:hypothetical protein
MAKRGPKITQICRNGHDTFICGRNNKGACKDCKREATRKWRKEIKEGLREKKLTKHIKQFCPQGHDLNVVGRTVDGKCKICVYERNAIYQKEHKEKMSEKGKEWRETHQEEVISYRQEYYNENKAEILRKNKDYIKQHPEVKAKSKIKTETNRALRVVAWTDWQNINKFIKNKPRGKIIDHFIPLQGDEVSGLHVSWNLQYLTPLQNARKYNKVNLMKISEWYGQILQQVGLK